MDRERRKLEAEAAKRADEKLASDAGLLPHIFGGVAGLRLTRAMRIIARRRSTARRWLYNSA